MISWVIDRPRGRRGSVVVGQLVGWLIGGVTTWGSAGRLAWVRLLGPVVWVVMGVG
jgi:hypothetical protein